MFVSPTATGSGDPSVLGNDRFWNTFEQERRPKGGSMEKEWVDFQTVKAAVNMQMVLDHYGITGLKRLCENSVGASLLRNQYQAPSWIHYGCAA